MGLLDPAADIVSGGTAAAYGGLAVAVAVIGGVIGGLFWSARDGDLLHVETDGATLRFRPRGANALWMLRREVAVPAGAVVAVREGVPRREAPSGIRLPGAHLPGVLTAGRYRSRSGVSLWLVARDRAVTVIDVEGQRFDHLVLQLSPDEVALVRSTTGR